MDNLNEILDKIFSDTLLKIIISNPISNEEEYKKITAGKSGEKYHIEMLTQKQAFHKNISDSQLREFVEKLFGTRFRQTNARGENREYELKLSKKGKLLFTSRAAKSIEAPEPGQDNKKNYIITPGIVPPLVDMGVFTKDGKVAAPLYNKFRQINRFVELIDDEISKWDKNTPLKIVDFGCGKSYITFVVYYYLTEIRKLKVHMTGLDLKEDVIKKCNRAALKYGYDNLSFYCGDIKDYLYKEKTDAIITLHACDTATDYALAGAINNNVKMIFSVPCCQHELNSQIRSDSFSILTRYGIIKERTAALMTDAIRANLLEYCGYKTQLIEFVDFEHTPKNIMIRAVKRKKNVDRNQYLSECERLITEFHLDPTLYRLIIENE